MSAWGSSVRSDFRSLFETDAGRGWLAGWVPGYVTGVWAAAILSAAACWIGAPPWSWLLGYALGTGITLVTTVVLRLIGGVQ